MTNPLGPVVPGLAQQPSGHAVAPHLQSLEADRRPRDVAAELLQLRVGPTESARAFPKPGSSCSCSLESTNSHGTSSPPREGKIMTAAHDG